MMNFELLIETFSADRKRSIRINKIVTAASELEARRSVTRPRTIVRSVKAL